MRIRQVIAAVMILLSFTAQARTVFACATMAGGAPNACCCPAGGQDHWPSGAANGACCDPVAPADAPFAHAAAEAGGKHPQHADHPAFGPAPYLLSAPFDTGDRGGPPDPRHALVRSPLPLYLLTARLRL